MLQENRQRNVLQITILAEVTILILFNFVQMTCAAAAHNSKERHGHKGNKHDAYHMWGGKKELEEFEHLSPAVVKERLKELASKMDKNSDGKIEKKELRVCYTEISLLQIIM